MQRLRGLLVVTEFALSLMLLVGAGLLVRTFWNLANVNLGFASGNLLTTNLRLDEETYADEAAQQRFFRALFEKLNAIPGVSAVAGTNVAPLRGFNDMYFTIEGLPPLPEGQKQSAQNRIVTAGYFEALGIRTLAGRVFGPGDRAGSPEVAVVNEAFAKAFLKGENVVGRKITVDGRPPRTAEIVGVVSSVRQRTSLDPFPEMYAPVEQIPSGNLDLLVRTSGVPPASVASAVRAAVQELDSTQTPGEFRTMEDVVDGTISRQRFTATLMLGFAVVALVLAGVGISGVLSHAVALRQQEIGVRMALGAGISSVVRLVLRQGMGMALLGTGLGLAGAFAMARTLQTMLFGIQPHDGPTFAAVCLFLLMVAALACLIPARRAARVDPIVTLRHQ
jgi:putative ABC transport system permease protein